jgi:hypothetical protein
MSECSAQEEAAPVVTLWRRQWRREALPARAGRLEQVAGMRMVEGGNGAERDVRLLRGTMGAGFAFETLAGTPLARQMRAPEEESDGKR